MTTTADTAGVEEFSGYAHPDKLVSTQWVADHLEHPALVVVDATVLGVLQGGFGHHRP